MTVFSTEARRTFAGNYPEVPHKLPHALGQHPLLELGALAELAEKLPPSSIEYNFADLPIGVDGKPDPTGIPIGETIRKIEETGSWAVLKNVEQVPAYAALLNELLNEIRPEIEAKTGAMMKLQSFIFITLLNGVTPYHFDPEHNILLQIRGSKVMTQFPAGDARFAPDEVHEGYHTGGARELKCVTNCSLEGPSFRSPRVRPCSFPSWRRISSGPGRTVLFRCQSPGAPTGRLPRRMPAPSTAYCAASATARAALAAGR